MYAADEGFFASAVLDILCDSFSGRTAVSGSCAMESREPRQVRKEAAVSESLHVPQGCLGAVARREKGEQPEGCFFLE